MVYDYDYFNGLMNVLFFWDDDEEDKDMAFFAIDEENGKVVIGLKKNINDKYYINSDFSKEEVLKMIKWLQNAIEITK